MFNPPPELEAAVEEWRLNHARSPQEFLGKVSWYLRARFWQEGCQEGSPYLTAFEIVKSRYDEFEAATGD